MHGEAHVSSRTAPAQLHRLKELVQRGDAEGFAHELNLDPRRTREWLEQGFPQDGYGAKVIKALGAMVLTRIVAPNPDREEHAHG